VQSFIPLRYNHPPSSSFWVYSRLQVKAMLWWNDEWPFCSDELPVASLADAGGIACMAVVRKTQLLESREEHDAIGATDAAVRATSNARLAHNVVPKKDLDPRSAGG